MWLCALFNFSNSFTDFPPPPDLPQNLLLLDVYMISTLIWWVMIPLGARFNHFSIVIYVDIRFLGDFKCFSCFVCLFVYLVWVILTCWDWTLESRPDLLLFPLLLLPPDCFLWTQGPSQPFRPCEDSVPRSSGVTIVVTQSVHREAALSHA